MSKTRPQKRPTDISARQDQHIEETLAHFERRLDDGFRLIEERRAAGIDVTALEEFWIDLLRQYEALCDGLPAAA